jgi:putative flippase GtrA
MTTLQQFNPLHIAFAAFAVLGVVQLLKLARALLMRVDSAGVVRGTRLILIGKGSAVRNATAAALATGADYSVFSSLVALTACGPPVATFIGAACGGMINFTLNRNWTFSASGSNRTMARRYVTVSAGSALLNAGLVAAFLWIPNQNLSLVWVVARGLVFLGWNYPLQRDYVFAHTKRGQAQS